MGAFDRQAGTLISQFTVWSVRKNLSESINPETR